MCRQLRGSCLFLSLLYGPARTVKPNGPTLVQQGECPGSFGRRTVPFAFQIHDTFSRACCGVKVGIAEFYMFIIYNFQS